MDSAVAVRVMFARVARSLVRAPAYSLAVVGSLALGVGANSALFSLVRRTILRPLPFAHPQRLVVVGTGTPYGVNWRSSSFDIDGWERSAPSLRTLEGLAWVGESTRGVIAADPQRPINTAVASANLPEVLGVRPRLGRWFSEAEMRRGDPVVVLSYSTWLGRFAGAPGIVGQQSIRIQDRSYTVIGVMPPDVELSLSTDCWYASHDFLLAEVWGRLRAGATLPSASRELRARVRRRDRTGARQEHGRRRRDRSTPVVRRQ